MIPARLFSLVLLSLLAALTVSAAQAPKIVKTNGRYQLVVDGQPFFVLGAQINNSSSWPSTLPEVWPAIEAMHANTVEAPNFKTWRRVLIGC